MDQAQPTYQYFYETQKVRTKHGTYVTQKRPRVTVCYLPTPSGVVYGIAICSKEDHPCKKMGRKIAYERATHAMTNGDVWCLPINRIEPIQCLERSDIGVVPSWKTGRGHAQFHFPRERP
jgi:hypothetical protein